MDDGNKEKRSEWLDRLHALFRGESDRAAAIVAGSMLETSLAELLKTSLLPIESGARPIRAKLLGESIGAAEQLGLISVQFAKDLCAVLDIRNYFAHHPFEATFQDQKVIALVAKLKAAHMATGPTTDWLSHETEERKDFLLCVSWMLWSIHSVTAETGAPKRPIKEFGYWTKEEQAAIDAAIAKTIEPRDRPTTDSGG